MIQELSTTEFIAGIANDLYDENDIVKYCSTLNNIRAFYVALMVEQSRMIAKNKSPIVSFKKGAVLQGDDYDCMMTSEDKRKLSHIDMALIVVEELMGEQKRTEPQRDKEKSIEQYINGTDKETIIRAINSLVRGKKGKQPAVIIAAAVLDGYMSKPTFDILKEAFGIEGSKTGFNKYYGLYTAAKCTRMSDVGAAKAALKNAISGAV